MTGTAWPASDVAYGLGGPAVRGIDETPLALANRARISAQVNAFRGRLLETQILSTKRADLQERADRDFTRPVLLDETRRLRKLAVETGREHPVTHEILPPLEPWTCPDHTGAIRTYAQIMRAPHGSYRLADFDAGQLGHLAYMADEQLITIGPGGTVHALGDRTGGDQRKYPGAPVGDEQAKVGRTLRGRARELVMTAWRNITYGVPQLITRRPSQLRSGGVALTVREICAEANAIRCRRPDLDGYRYLHIETCRRVIAGLLADGTLCELEPPSRTRAGRTWITIPRVYELPRDAAEWPVGRPADRRRVRHGVRHRLRHRLRQAA